MDNFTLLYTLIIILGINALFTFIISRNTDNLGRMEWRSSSLLLFTGFFLILLQQRIPPFLSICAANYLLLLGFFFQVSSALSIENKKRFVNVPLLLSLSGAYWVLFIYFSYFRFDTSIRIIIISVILMIFYLYGAFRMTRMYTRREKKQRMAQEVFYLFCFSALFYLTRLTVTVMGAGVVNSLFDINLMTTISFLYLIVFNLLFLMSMFSASLRQKNQLIIHEKEKMNYLFSFLHNTASHLELDKLYKSIEEILKEALGVRTAALFLVDKKSGGHSITYVFNELDLPLEGVTTLKKGEGASGRAIEEDRVIVMNMDNYPNRSVAEVYRTRGVTELVSVPLKTMEGIIGAITIVYTKEMRIDILDHDFVYFMGEQIGLVLHNAFLYERVSLLANTDSLTGLFNRRKMLEIFDQEIRRTERNGRNFSLAMADLDFFKSVNDTYGHECGDMVLQRTAELLKRECRDTDYICRWGGEEFFLLFIETDLSEALSICERIRLGISKKGPDCLKDRNLTLSLGVTMYNPSLTIEQMIDTADRALYQAKRNGRNRIETFIEK